MHRTTLSKAKDLSPDKYIKDWGKLLKKFPPDPLQNFMVLRCKAAY